MNKLNVRMKHKRKCDTYKEVSRLRKDDKGNLIISFVDEEKADVIYLSPAWKKVEHVEE